ncbi:MAG: L-histidine N(alpha)-methyltransferase [Acidobacteriota bacterium]|nr:L-histidine N(alpha)-methyltransferase [Acidobacteriota bacterium]MDH3785877.1 L-histidine N(alpha)-methyltransferase [Acidobacteriota bacterium]
MAGKTSEVDIADARGTEELLDDVIAGLAATNKSLPSKYFYDEAGSRLFDEITRLDEYYVTRTEQAIMDRHAGEMGEQIAENVMLVEYGAGSSIKTRALLDHLDDPVAYVPVDISREHLNQSAESLQAAYPDIEVLPVVGDFTQPFELPIARRTPDHVAAYFPGSTIGNFETEAAHRILRGIAPLCGSGGGLLIGVDLQKDPAVIEAAYNDVDGVTSRFNLNLLRRINRELGGDFDLSQFRHLATYDEKAGCVRTFIVSDVDQIVNVAGRQFSFASDERIHTENSYKYTIDGFAGDAAEAGLELHRVWTDARDYFAVMHFVVP